MSNNQPQGREYPYGWVIVLITAIMTGISQGSMVNISVFLKPLAADMGWLRGETVFGYTAGALSAGLGGILMGYVSDRFSLRPVVIFASVVIGVTYLLFSRLTALWQFYLYFCLMGGFGAGALYVILNANVGNWFHQNKGLAIGLATAGQAMGQGVLPYISRLLITSIGWRGAYQAMGIAVLALLLPLSLLMRAPPGQAEAKRGAISGQEEKMPLPTDGIVAWLSVAIVLCCMTMAAPVVHLVALVQDRGIGEERAARVLLLMLLAGVVGRIVFGKLADRITGIRAYFIASLGQSALVFWFTQLTGFAAFSIMAMAFGFFSSAVMTCLLISVRELTPLHRRSSSIGIVVSFGWVGMGLGGYQGGLFFDLTGSYLVPFANAAGLGMANLLVVGLLIYTLIRKQAALVRLQKA